MALDTDSSLPKFPKPEVFKKHAHLVRSLKCNNIHYHLPYLVPYCSGLTELEVIDLTDETLPLLELNTSTLMQITLERENIFVRSSIQVQRFLNLVDHCPLLRRVSLTNFAVDEQGEEETAEVYALRRERDNRNRRRPTLPLTRTGSISQTRSAEEITESVATFYRIISRLTELELSKIVIQRLPADRTMVFYRLRKLALLQSTMSYRDQLQLISQCQYLTHLKIQFTRMNERLDPQMLRDAGLEMNCPRMTHLDISWSTLEDQEIAELIQDIPQLVSFKARRTKTGGKTVAALAGELSRVRQQLIVLDVVDAMELESSSIQALLCSCPALRQFKATSLNVLDMMIESALVHTLSTLSPKVFRSASGEVSSRQVSKSRTSGWVCLQLQELHLSITGFSPGSIEEQILVYRQLSMLRNLQILNLGGSSDSTWLRVATLELSMNHGFDLFAALTELRVFNFSYMVHELGLREVDFMMQHWKKIRRVIGTIGTKEHGSIAVKGIQDGTGKSNWSRRRTVESPEFYVHRNWPHVQFSSR
ncbi:hypothetical protein EDD11_005562 [Mortierella claussenii]|nr:hypothetical protein EDD11_005562 [Mortierella claussenii]